MDGMQRLAGGIARELLDPRGYSLPYYVASLLTDWHDA